MIFKPADDSLLVLAFAAPTEKTAPKLVRLVKKDTIPKHVAGNVCRPEKDYGESLKYKEMVRKIQIDFECMENSDISVFSNLSVPTKAREICEFPMQFGKYYNSNPSRICESSVRFHNGVSDVPLHTGTKSKAKSSVLQDCLLCVDHPDKLRSTIPAAGRNPCNTNPHWTYKHGENYTTNLCVVGPKIGKLVQIYVAKVSKPKECIVIAGDLKWKRCVKPRIVNQCCKDRSRIVCGDLLGCLWKRCVMPCSAG